MTGDFMDRIDRTTLSALQKNDRISNVDLTLGPDYRSPPVSAVYHGWKSRVSLMAITLI